MAELGITYIIETPAGNLTFNDYSSADHYRLEAIRGMSAVGVRAAVYPLAQADGARVGDGFRGGLTAVFSGSIKHSTESNRRAKIDELRSKLHSILRADGTLKWTPTGMTQRQRTCRLFDGPDIPAEAGTILKPFQFSLFCEDPLAYSVTEDNSGTITCNGAAVNVTNDGDVPTYPKLRVYGTVTDAILKNNTTGKSLKLTGTITDPAYVEVDTNPLRRTILKNDGTVMTSMYTPAVSEMWSLSPGVNAVEFDGTSPSGAVKLVAYWRDAWAG